MAYFRSYRLIASRSGMVFESTGKPMWNYRTIEHRYLDDENDLCVHEVFYDEEGKPHAFTKNAIAPCSREEAELMLKAYDEPPIAWVNKKALDDREEDWGWL